VQGVLGYVECVFLGVVRVFEYRSIASLSVVLDNYELALAI
jgi:hypothetical protein